MYSKIKLSVVIPTINSENFISQNVEELEKFLNKTEEIEDYEIILAAQTSKDNTFEIIKKIKSKKIIKLFLEKKGKGIGLTAGFKKAKYGWVLMIDDDLPYPFESIKKLIKKTENYDIIIASRYVQKIKHSIPLLRRLASAVYLKLVKMMIDIPQKDIQAGMKLIKKTLFEKTHYPKEEGYVWDTEMLYLANKAEFHIIEVPVECVHKPNQLVVYRAALKMFFGILRVWWNGKHLKRFDYDSVPGDYQYNVIINGNSFQKFWHLYKIKLINRLLKIKKEDIILDLGCGSGNILIDLSKKVKIAYGADISSNALNFISKRIEKENIKNIKLVKIESQELPFENSFFDKIIATELIEHLEDPSYLIKECFRILKLNGLLILTTPNYHSFWPILEYLSDLFHLTPKMKDEQHVSKFNKKSLKNLLLNNKFKIVKNSSFYCLSPFLSLISSDIADKIFGWELKNKIYPGMLIYCIAKK
jgi:ubiquinone/menaquinone biosynthesis C-methylase UbiE